MVLSKSGIGTNWVKLALSGGGIGPNWSKLALSGGGIGPNWAKLALSGVELGQIGSSWHYRGVGLGHKWPILVTVDEFEGWAGSSSGHLQLFGSIRWEASYRNIEIDIPAKDVAKESG